ncbi:MAG: dihydroneopterin aldolase [Candidatus Amulumruptor caecigallinarius]|nr:dihydroneopterin aldolase [Candidatus Amulumruptor caecigallinarius]MCM1397691.1 dihydroneopterin aldolase [Candidatus Amulumruptor caecigallinarius]MCM1454680.1 dihydroneopterin aldolase [bacterium]
MKTTISVSRMCVHGFHGVSAQEQRVGIDFEVSASLTLDLPTEALASDRLDATVSYAEMAEVIRREMACPHALIETAAEAIRRALVAEWPQTAGGSVTVAKLHPPVPGAEIAQAEVTLVWP